MDKPTGPMSDVRCPMSGATRYARFGAALPSHSIGHRTSDIGHRTSPRCFP